MTKFEIALELTETPHTSSILDAIVSLDPSTTRKAAALWAAENAILELGTEITLEEGFEKAYSELKLSKI